MPTNFSLAGVGSQARVAKETRARAEAVMKVFMMRCPKDDG
jgi:hypothetical protein